jgi:pyruvate/2-oxoglutarate/acetoin dehydrogenase E1 component
MEHKGLYTVREPRRAAPQDPPAAVSPRAAVRRAGRDVTVVAYSAMVRVALEAANRMAGEGIEVEVVDPRCLAPLDETGLLSSVRRTHRLVVLHEAPGPGGLGAEIAARLGELAFDDLDAPIRRLAGAAVPMPFSPPLEAAAVPSPATLCAVLREVVA